MEEKPHERLLRLAQVLHWMGKYTEANEVTGLAIWAQQQGIESHDELMAILRPDLHKGD